MVSVLLQIKSDELGLNIDEVRHTRSIIFILLLGRRLMGWLWLLRNTLDDL
jgi:hypothetical protein